MTDIKIIKELKRELKRTWITFFGRFGKLLPVQIETIPLVLECKNAVITSPTASGKTEAIIAPLIERLFNEGWRSLAILYISPTRALVNDIFYRLKEQLEELGISTSLKTGDKPSFNPQKLPNLLITTPESFDSLLCRHPQVFRELRAVVLDEIHLVDNTYRGDQIRLLLKRLRYITETEFNIYALSATIADPKDIGNRYFNDFEVIKSHGRREIEYTLVKSLKDVFEHARNEKLKKMLIFCNKRKSVEMMAIKARNLWGRDKVVVHHGSLSKAIREEAESFMKESQFGVCIATMSLEIGIDIGDIDAIVLAEVPWSISSLLQRIGRGNRRTQKNRVFALYDSEDEAALLEEMLNVAINGYVEEVDYSPDLSVVVQQIFSSLYAHPNGLGGGYFSEIFNEFCSEDDLKDILRHLAEYEWIEKGNGRWRASTKLMDLGGWGKIHSNIADSKALKVIDINSQQTIGEVQYPIDEVFVLAGKVWKIINVVVDKIYVKQVKAKASAVKFKRHASKGAFYYLLPKDLRTKLDDH
jgi:ATP-dependent Lhr-like helicase